MALPPEPLATVLPLATVIVQGEVVRIVHTGKAPPPSTAPKNASDRGTRYAEQTVELRVEKALRGKPSSTLASVKKPEGAYTLEPGMKGVFLLDDDSAILGRYGPDTYRADAVEHALAH
jgi:hypothetical protein